MKLLLASLALPVLLLLPAGAGAAIVSQSKGGPAQIEIRDFADETNDVTIRPGAEPDSILVEDGGAELIASQACEQAGSAVACRLEGLSSIVVSLGRGDDRLTAVGPLRVELLAAGGGGSDTLAVAGVKRPCLAGGPGDDTLSVSGPSVSCGLEGNGGDDVLRGGASRDRLDGGRGSDSLAAGAGNDRVRALDGSRDELVDCGAGRDRVLADRVDRPTGCERTATRRPPNIFMGDLTAMFSGMGPIAPTWDRE